ncbi:MAG: YicC/YloC family endoribonuclease, partial [Tissierella sp.]|uniref:YicC/YloC family endoribonuclease n=1 Tax=Tissierella sp. TaxID=41274 RepID=UPI003F9EAA69
MTGYGKGEDENELYRSKIEIKSVNHRYIDINIRLPRQINYLEEWIKKEIKKHLSR